MSLINDALKRAKEAQQKIPPPAAGPQFRPPEPAQSASQGMGMMLPFAIVLIALIGLFLFWQTRHTPRGNDLTAQTRLSSPTNPAPEIKQPAQTAISTPGAATNTPATEMPVTPLATPLPTASVPAPVIKLQAIFFAPGHSSAIISGKTVRTGDMVKGFRVAAINQSSATLVSATQTNVMTLEDQ